MTAAAFITMFLDFINRKDITRAQALQFINLAKEELQIEADLAFCLKKLSAQTYVADGTGFALPADFKKFPWQHSITLTDPQGRIVPIEGTDYGTVARRTHQRGPEMITGQVLPAVPTTDIQETKYYILQLSGESSPRMFFMPEAALTFDLYYIGMLGDYADDGTEDFLLKFGRKALLYRAAIVRNSFLMEDEKIPIDESEAEVALSKLQEYCRTVINSGAFIDGD